MPKIKPTIVIADDDQGVQDIFKIIFEKAGYRTIIFSNGNGVLENEEVPDIFLLDKQLSGTDGMDICKKLKTKKATRHVPVIMVSATPGLEQLAKNAGADDFIEKPFSTHDLLDKIKRILHQDSAEKFLSF